jgi:hypothetical protein
MRVDHEKKDVLLMSLTGLESQDIEEEVVVQGSGLSRGDKRRNARLARLRELVPAGNAILGIDLADQKQALVLADLEQHPEQARPSSPNSIARCREPTPFDELRRDEERAGPPPP